MSRSSSPLLGSRSYQVQINETEDDNDIKPSIWKRKVCCGKLKVWHLLLIILITIISMLLLSYFVIVPSIVQKVINKSQLTFTSISMQNIQNDTVAIYADGLVTNTGSISATITQSSSLSVYYQNLHLAYLDMPSIKVEGNTPSTSLTIDGSPITITNTSLFGQYGSDLLNTDQADWELVGYVDVTVFGITFNKINFKKTLSVPGMKGLKKVTIHNFNLPSDSPGQIDLTINASIHNPSFVSMEIGDMYFDIIYQNTSVGTLYAPDVTMTNGTNNLEMTGYLEAPDNESLQAIAVFFNKYLSGDNLVVTVRGIGGNDSAPDWLNEILQSIDMSTTIAGAQGLTLVSGMTLGALFMGLPGNAGDSTDSGIVSLSSLVQSVFKPPFPITLNVQSVSISANMTAYGKVIANITDSPFYPAFLNDTAMILNINMTDANLQIVDRPGFMELVSQLMLTPGADTYLSGVSSAWVSTQVGDILLTNITLPNQLIPLEGLNGFADLITIDQPNNDVTGGYKWGMAMNLRTTINNPSSVSIALSSMSFDMYYQGIYIGNASVDNFLLEQGPNSVACSGNYHKPSDESIEVEFLSKFLQGNDTDVNLLGNSNNIPLLIPAMQKLNISVVFPGQKQDIVRWVQLLKVVPLPSSSMALYNPMISNITVISTTNFKIYKLDWSFFSGVDDTIFDPPYQIAHDETIMTAPVGLPFSWSEFFSIFEGYTKGNHTLITTGQVGFQIGEYGPLLLNMQQVFTLVGTSD